MPDNHPSSDDKLDDEIELEPVDPEILAYQRHHAEHQTDLAQAAVDEDLIHRAEDPGDPLTLEELKKIRFTMRHLVIVTALLALVMAVCQLVGTGTGFFITATLAVSAGWLFTLRHQRRHEAMVEQMRSDMAARREARKRAGNAVAEDDFSGKTPATFSTDLSRRGDPMESRPTLKFSFSMKEMLLAVTTAAFLLGLVSLLGPGPMAILLGMVALGGLVAQAIEVEAPPIVVFYWWVLLVLYLILGFWFSTTASDQAALRPGSPATRRSQRADPTSWTIRPNTRLPATVLRTCFTTQIPRFPPRTWVAGIRLPESTWISIMCVAGNLPPEWIENGVGKVRDLA